MANISGYLALGTMADGSTAFAEMTGGAYARAAITLVPARGGKLRNDAVVLFPAATGAKWPIYTAVAVFDAVSSGNQIMAWQVDDQPQNELLVGRQVRFGVGDIELSFPRPLSNNGSEIVMSGPYTMGPAGLFLTPSIIVLSQAAYDALPVKDALTVYMIEEEA